MTWVSTHSRALQESNHAVRRNRWLIHENMYPVDSLRKVFQYIQRVRGFSWTLLVHLQSQTVVSANHAAIDPTSRRRKKGLASALSRHSKIDRAPQSLCEDQTASLRTNVLLEALLAAG